MESITLIAVGKNYEDAVTNAILELKRYLPEDAQIYRHMDDRAFEERDWYVADVIGNLAAVDGTIFQVEVDFVLVGSEVFSSETESE